MYFSQIVRNCKKLSLTRVGRFYYLVKFENKSSEYQCVQNSVLNIVPINGWATIRPKRQFVPSDNSSQIPKSDNSSHFEKATIRPICKKRQFVPNCLIDQLITNLLKVETKEIIKPTTNEFIQPRDNN